MDGATLFVAILGALGIGGILTAVVTGAFNRRKLSADATEIITKAASGVVERLEAELARKQADHDKKVDTLKARLDTVLQDWAREREEWRAVLQLHVAFDTMAIAKLAELEIDLGPAPPLLPPLRADLSTLGEL